MMKSYFTTNNKHIYNQPQPTILYTQTKQNNTKHNENHHSITKSDPMDEITNITSPVQPPIIPNKLYVSMIATPLTRSQSRATIDAAAKRR
jgi:hypothetical protein